jgi:hypothetical protein
MTWHTAIVATDRMTAVLTTIRNTGGTLTHCQPQTAGVRLTWTTTSRSDARCAQTPSSCA